MQKSVWEVPLEFLKSAVNFQIDPKGFLYYYWIFLQENFLYIFSKIFLIPTLICDKTY